MLSPTYPLRSPTRLLLCSLKRTYTSHVPANSPTTSLQWLTSRPDAISRFVEERQFIKQIIETVPNPRDFRQYVKTYSEKNQFAIVKLQDLLSFERGKESPKPYDVDQLASSLFRLQRLGLYPIVVMDNPLFELQTHRRIGHVYDINQHSRKILNRRCIEMVEAIEQVGGRATPILDGLFLLDQPVEAGDHAFTVPLDTASIASAATAATANQPIFSASQLNAVGSATDPDTRLLPPAAPAAIASSSTSVIVKDHHYDRHRTADVASDPEKSCTRSIPKFFATMTDLASLESAIRLGHIPVIAPIADAPSGQRYHVDVDIATYTLGKLLKPLKTIVIHPDGCIRHPVTRQRLQSINLEEDFGQLVEKLSNSSPGNRSNLVLMRRLLAELPPTCAGIVTVPDSLVNQVFATKALNMGTMIRHGMHISVHNSWESVDLEKLKNLLEDAFGKNLDERYWEQIHDRLRAIYIAGDYQGTAIITTEGGIPYLDKFAVAHTGQGQGIGEILWSYIRRDNKDLFWRSRIDNGVNHWYFEHSDGNYRVGRWVVFWCGLKSLDMMQFYADCAARLPPTMHQKMMKPHNTMTDSGRKHSLEFDEEGFEERANRGGDQKRYAYGQREDESEHDRRPVPVPVAQQAQSTGAGDPIGGVGYDPSTNVPIRALVSTKEASVIIGKSGVHINDIRKVSGARVNISENVAGSGERILTVTGTVESIGKAFGMIGQKYIEESLQNSGKDGRPSLDRATVRLLVSHLRMGRIIGKERSKIKEIQDASAALMTTATDMLPNSNERVLTVTGVPDAIHIAVYHVATILRDFPDRQPLIPYRPGVILPTMGMPSPFGGGSGGVGGRPPFVGSHASNMPHTPVPSSRMDPFGRSGHVDSMFGGPAPSFGRAPQPSSGQPVHNQTIFVPSDIVGNLIGKGGAKINEIRQQSGATIKIGDPVAGEHERAITVSGTTESVQAAAYLIYTRVDQEKARKSARLAQ